MNIFCIIQILFWIIQIIYDIKLELLCRNRYHYDTHTLVKNYKYFIYAAYQLT